MSTEPAVILSCNTPACASRLTWLPGGGLTIREAAAALGWECVETGDTCPTCLMDRDAAARTT